MKKHNKKISVWGLIICFVVTQILFSSVAFAQTSQYKRLSGADRYKTAASISQKGWPNGSFYAVLARGDDFADALCAGPLAKKYDAPILLTEPDGLNSDTLAEINRLGVKHVIIAGGTGAVSQKVEDALDSAGISDVVRIGGKDRYETSVKIAEKLGKVSEAAVAAGTNYPDAMSISSAASSLGMPILLTEKDNLPEKVKNYIADNNIKKSYVVGGTGVIGSDVEALLPGALRIGGKDRYETNAAVIETFAGKLDFSKLYVAVGEGPNGDEFADALTGTALAARTSSPVVLVYKNIPGVTGNLLKNYINLATKVYALGGDAVVPQNIIDGILAYKESIPVSAKYDKAGTFGTAEGTDTIDGNVVISAAGVTLQNTVIEGDLLLAESIGDGNVTLNNVTVKGMTIVNGGGPNSVVMYNFNGQTVVVDVPDGSSVRLVANGNTSIKSVTMNSNGKLEESGLTGSGFTDVVIPEGASVVLSGAFNKVDVKAAGSNVKLESGSIAALNIDKSAVKAVVNVAAGTKVDAFEINAPVDVTGTGRIVSVTINSEGVTLEKEPESTKIADDVTANIGGKDVTNEDVKPAPSSGGNGGNGGGGGSHKNNVTPESVSIVPSSDTLYYKTSKQLAATVTYSDGTTGKSASWASSDTSIATVSGNGTVQACDKAGTVTITASATQNGVTKGDSCTITVKSLLPANHTLPSMLDVIKQAFMNLDDDDWNTLKTKRDEFLKADDGSERDVDDMIASLQDAGFPKALEAVLGSNVTIDEARTTLGIIMDLAYVGRDNIDNLDLVEDKINTLKLLYSDEIDRLLNQGVDQEAVYEYMVDLYNDVLENPLTNNDYYEQELYDKALDVVRNGNHADLARVMANAFERVKAAYDVPDDLNVTFDNLSGKEVLIAKDMILKNGDDYKNSDVENFVELTDYLLNLSKEFLPTK